MSNLLKGNNIIKETTASNKPGLLSTDEIWENKLKSVSQDFGQNFEAHIAKRYRSEIRDQKRVFFFWDQSNKDPTPRRRERRVEEKILNCSKQMITKIRPEKLIKLSIKTIKSNAFTSGEVHSDTINFFLGNLTNEHLVIRRRKLGKVIRQSRKDIKEGFSRGISPQIRVIIQKSIVSCFWISINFSI